MYYLLLILFSFSTAYSLEPGLYSAIENPLEQRAIWDLKKSADRNIDYLGSDRYDIGLKELDSVHGIQRILYINFSQLESFLENEKHKDLIVIFFHKPAVVKHNFSDGKFVKELCNSLQSIGYKRVLVLGANSSGTWVLADSSND